MTIEEIQTKCEELSAACERLLAETEDRKATAFAWQDECDERTDALEYVRDYLDMTSNLYVEELP